MYDPCSANHASLDLADIDIIIKTIPQETVATPTASSSAVTALSPRLPRCRA
jgi:hypothetical protein